MRWGRPCRGSRGCRPGPGPGGCAAAAPRPAPRRRGDSSGDALNVPSAGNLSHKFHRKMVSQALVPGERPVIIDNQYAE